MTVPRLLLLSLALISCGRAANEKTKAQKIVFLGDSITYSGRYVELVETALIAQYPNARIEILNMGLPSETVSGVSEPGHAGGNFPRPDLAERIDRILTVTKPTIVYACYGINCGIYSPQSLERFDAFKKGIESLRSKVIASGVRMIHLTPPVFDALPLGTNVLPAGLDSYPKPFAGYDDVLSDYSAWLVSKRIAGWSVIDVHSEMKSALTEARKTRPDFTFSKDGVHANEGGHRVIAKAVCRYMGLQVTEPDHIILERVEQKQRPQKNAWLAAVGHKRPGMKQGASVEAVEQQAAELLTNARDYARKELGDGAPPFPATKGNWKGFDKYDVSVDGRTLTIVVPKTPAPGKPWCWEGEFFGHKPAPSIALLQKGFHIVYYHAQNLLGCPEAVAQWNAAYDYLVHLGGLNPKPALTGLSRGGLYAFNWAIANPQRVACIYADAAVCDFKSWPGGKGKGKGGGGEWKKVLQVYGFADEAEALAYKGNPIDNLAPLAKAGVPLLHVYGDADKVVPWDENTGIVAERYQALGGKITLIPKPGVDHHPHGLADSTPIVEFIVKHTNL